ncbi:hypothetical protein C8R45DRAFT_1094297 [Mycena sanguinolenta]|nr:hypothetical protein C8R45DRAFT_1094297 [Mycena sanguinolenta]
MDAFTATIPTKQEDVILPPVNADGGGGSSGSCVVCKEDVSLPPMNEDGGGGSSSPHIGIIPTSGHSSSVTSIKFTRTPIRFFTF